MRFHHHTLKESVYKMNCYCGMDTEKKVQNKNGQTTRSPQTSSKMCNKEIICMASAIKERKEEI
jgi:hypothetical protein